MSLFQNHALTISVILILLVIGWILCSPTTRRNHSKKRFWPLSPNTLSCIPLFLRSCARF
jgi:hypothetical protein